MGTKEVGYTLHLKNRWNSRHMGDFQPGWHIRIRSSVGMFQAKYIITTSTNIKK